MKCLLVYSSITGNTRAVAEAIHSVLPHGTPLCALEEAPDPLTYDFILLGFWVWRAGPDPQMEAYMKQITGKVVTFFATMAAWPDSAHAAQVITNTAALLQNNLIAGHFLCQGKLARFNPDAEEEYRTTHPMTPERLARLREAARHPNENDFNRARQVFTDMIQQYVRVRP